MSASSMRESVLAKIRRPPTFARTARNLVACLAVGVLAIAAAVELDGILSLLFWLEAAYYIGASVIAAVAFIYIGVGSFTERAS